MVIKNISALICNLASLVQAGNRIFFFRRPSKLKTQSYFLDNLYYFLLSKMLLTNELEEDFNSFVKRIDWNKINKRLTVFEVPFLKNNEEKLCLLRAFILMKYYNLDTDEFLNQVYRRIDWFIFIKPSYYRNIFNKININKFEMLMTEKNKYESILGPIFRSKVSEAFEQKAS